MSLFNENNSTALGTGLLCPAGSVADKSVLGNFRRYKARVAGSYRAVLPDEITKTLASGKHWVSPKVDGELWYLVLGEGAPFLASPQGKVIAGSMPLLEEAGSVASKVACRTIIAGELFAAVKSGRPRVGDLKSALGGGPDAEVQRLGFSAFDLLEGGTKESQMPLDDYNERLAVLQKLFDGGKRIKAIATHECNSGDEINTLFLDLVQSGKAEGLVARNEGGLIYKIKPSITLDMVVLGYTERTHDVTQVRSLLLGLMRADGHYQIIGGCGSLGSDENRKALMKRIQPLCADSDLHYASGSGEVYHFTHPEVIVEIKVTDIQAENTAGDAIKDSVLMFSEGKWHAVSQMPSVSLLHPVLIRERNDKSVNITDVRLSQILERTFIGEADDKAEQKTLPKSTLLTRKVWVKETKGVKAVQKLLIWKTNKDSGDINFPAYVVHWTDYSAGRKDPLKREVRLGQNEAAAFKVGDDMVATKIKKGWELLGEA